MKKRWVTPSFEASSENVSKKQGSEDSKKLRKGNSGSTKLPTRLKHHSADILLKYQPKTVDDLVIHPKKIKELETCLRDLISTSIPDSVGKKYLLLQGPSGCGKTATFRILAQSLGIHIIEWITPIDRDSSTTELSNEESDHVFRNSAYDLFDDFLWHASRYGGLLKSSQSNIILIKDFPNTLIQNPDSFHNLVRKYYELKSYPIVFICNDDKICRTLFSDAICKECNIQTLVFNPVNCTATLKALKRVLELERQSDTIANVPSMADLRNIYEISNGDLRSALLRLHFNAVKPCPSSCGEVIENCNTFDQSINKDPLLDLFKSLGRVLYSKRITKTSDTNQYTFVHDPDEIVKTLTSQSFVFVSFLQENYISRFSDINCVARAADKFSTFDILSERFNRDTEVIASDFIVRSLMVINSQPKKSFSSFRKPKFHHQTTITELSRNVRNLFPNYQISSSELIMYLLPSLKSSRQFSLSFNDSQLKFINSCAFQI